MPLTQQQKQGLEGKCKKFWEQYESEIDIEFSKDSGLKKGVFKRVGPVNSIGFVIPPVLTAGAAINFGVTDSAPPNPVFLITAIGMVLYQAHYMLQTHTEQGELDQKEQEIKEAVVIGQDTTLRGNYNLTHQPQNHRQRVFPNKSTFLELLGSVASSAILFYGALAEWTRDQETGAVSGIEAWEAVGLFCAAAVGAMALHASRLYNGMSNNVRTNAQSYKRELSTKLLEAHQVLLNKDAQGNDHIIPATFNAFVNGLGNLTNRQNVSNQGLQSLQSTIDAMRSLNRASAAQNAAQQAVQVAQLVHNAAMQQMQDINDDLTAENAQLTRRVQRRDKTIEKLEAQLKGNGQAK